MKSLVTNREGARQRFIAATLTILGVVLLGLDIYWLKIITVEAIDLPTAVYITICGDGLTSQGELCDLGTGNNIGTYASSTAARICAAGCNSFGPYCGDGVLQVRFGEACDDGNNTSGDLCSSSCVSETAVSSSPSGSPTVGAVPVIPNANPGSIPGITATKVVLRGKAYPNTEVTILLDGKTLGKTQADANADFLYTSNAITPGVASFGFLAYDVNGISSITTAAVFDVVQSAITTVSNVFIPPSIAVNKTQVAPGQLLTISGQSVPFAKIKTDIFANGKTSFSADADETGLWALQVDTKSLTNGQNSAKSTFEITSTIKSGYGRSVNFFVGTGSPLSAPSPDLNQDGKVNLVDFSIFLISWNTTNARTDFNMDKATNLADFSIMLFNWTG